ncbi:MAG: ABC transporter substrate-binding protein [Rickettsiaceae bacterium]|nr:ABC transporter substrate-binding protein [Rickettsiaceae bacterium]
MRNLLTILLIILFTTVTNAEVIKPNKKVLISQFVKHPALDITTKGIIDGLAQEGYKTDINLELRVESAQANSALAQQIANKFVNQNSDIVVGVATISAQSFMKFAKENKVRLIFSTVTDPVKASLVNNLEQPGGNVSGVSNFVELRPQLELFVKIQPKLKRLGFLYNPGELNSISLIERLETLCPKLGITLVKQMVSKTSDVSQAATKLAANVDAIFISNDNTALGALQTIISTANKEKIPVYVSDTDAVKLGALAALGPNQYQVGLQTGKMISKVLDGKDIGNMAIEFPETTDLYINEEAANLLQLNILDDIRKSATKIISKSNL